MLAPDEGRVVDTRAQERSAACLPLSTMRPSLSTMILSAFTAVESRWAMTHVVRPRIRGFDGMLHGLLGDAGRAGGDAARIKA